jgi:GTP diphosphokinase / guanosine-3',5'-bis(diphosphate) 3'-diphosphatase
VPLGYQLQLGDICEILTSKSSPGPSKDWLGIARTSRARSKIRQWFSKESREDSEQLGRDLLQKALRKQGVGLAVLNRADVLGQVASQMNFAKPETLIAAVGAGKVSPQQVGTKIMMLLNKPPVDAQTEEIPVPIKPPARPRSNGTSTGVHVKGIDDLLIRLAHCCHPVPGDPIMGFVTRGRGLSVHRADCPNAEGLNAYPDRILDVYWDSKQLTTYQVEIQVEAVDRTKLLSDISTVLSDAGVNILSATVSTRRDRLAVFRFVFEIGNLANLTHIIANVKRIEAVFDAYRVLPT